MSNQPVALDQSSWERLRDTVQNIEGQTRTELDPPRSAAPVFRDVSLFVLRTELVPGGTAIGTRVTYDMRSKTFCGDGEDDLLLGVSGPIRWAEGSVVTAVKVPSAGWCVFTSDRVAQFTDGTKIEDVPAYALLAMSPGQPTLPGAIPVACPGGTINGDDMWKDNYLAAGDAMFRYKLGRNGPEFLEATSCTPIPAWVAWEETINDGIPKQPVGLAAPFKGRFTVGYPKVEEDGVVQRYQMYRGYLPHVEFILNSSPARSNDPYVPEVFYHRLIPVDFSFGPTDLQSPNDDSSRRLPLLVAQRLPYYWPVNGFSTDPKLCWVTPYYTWHRRVVARTGRDQNNFDETQNRIIEDPESGDQGRYPRISVPTDINGDYL